VDIVDIDNFIDMPKYVIEGGIDFYAELNQPPQSSNDDTAAAAVNASGTTAMMLEPDDDTKVCLLSKMPLEYGHITLPCNHMFNFMPLYNEVLSQKTNPKLLNNVYHNRLSKSQVKCPYCRVVHDSALLPYIVGDKRVLGVNAPSTLCMDAPFKCQHSVIVNKMVSGIDGKRKKQAILTECSAVKNIYCHRRDDVFMFLCKKHTSFEIQKKTTISKNPSSTG
jgi:hypothetical protein